jgi:general secretion pathway protein A
MIAYRVSVAGRERPLFTPAALAALYDQSDGIPRTAINLCEYALEVAFADDADIVDEVHVRRATGGVEQGRLREAPGAPAAPLLAGTGGLA